MCGRYKLEDHWKEYCKAAQFTWQDPPWPTPNPLKGSEEARPTDPMPIIRRNEGEKSPRTPPLGRHPLVSRKDDRTETGKRKEIKRDVINVIGEKLTTSYMWKWSSRSAAASCR